MIVRAKEHFKTLSTNPKSHMLSSLYIYDHPQSYSTIKGSTLKLPSPLHISSSHLVREKRDGSSLPHACSPRPYLLSRHRFWS